MSVENLKAHIRVIPDFPKKGIMFQDISTLMNDSECLTELIDTISEAFKGKGITKVVGLESRGFILGPAVASRLGAGFVMARKTGKLPCETVKQDYTKEYGIDTIEISRDALSPEDVVLIHDDLLASGGTVEAAVKLVRQFGVTDIKSSFVIELLDLKGRSRFSDIETHSVITV